MNLINEIYTENELLEVYKPWGSANYNLEKIIKSNNISIFLEELEELYPDGIALVTLNDILWFDDEFCFNFIDDEYLDEEELAIKYQ